MLRKYIDSSLGLRLLLSPILFLYILRCSICKSIQKILRHLLFLKFSSIVTYNCFVAISSAFVTLSSRPYTIPFKMGSSTSITCNAFLRLCFSFNGSLVWFWGLWFEDSVILTLRISCSISFLHAFLSCYLGIIKSFFLL